MKKLILVLSAVVVAFVGFVLYYRWDSGTNHGYQFGYYGEFNRVSNALNETAHDYLDYARL